MTVREPYLCLTCNRVMVIRRCITNRAGQPDIAVVLAMLRQAGNAVGSNTRRACHSNETFLIIRRTDLVPSNEGGAALKQQEPHS